MRDSVTNTDRHRYCHSDAYGYSYCDGDGNSYSYSYVYSHTNSHSNGDANTAAEPDANSDCNGYPDTNANSWATTGGPTALNATNRTATSFTANWRSVAGATGYRLDVATSSSFVNYVPGYQDLDVGNTTSRNVTGLTKSTNYYYRLRAYNGNGTSPNSNVIKVKTRSH